MDFRVRSLTSSLKSRPVTSCWMGSELSGKSLSPAEPLQQPGHYPHFTHKKTKAQRDSEA